MISQHCRNEMLVILHWTHLIQWWLLCRRWFLVFVGSQQGAEFTWKKYDWINFILKEMV